MSDHHDKLTPDEKKGVMKKIAISILGTSVFLGAWFAIGGLKTLAIAMFLSTLANVAYFHHQSRFVAMGGAVIVSAYFAFLGGSLGEKIHHEWHQLVEVGVLLVGYPVLSGLFNLSNLGHKMPEILPDDERGGRRLLYFVFWASALLDNIAAALLGGAVARTIFHGRFTMHYVGAIIIASNAGGAPWATGDTTTTMMSMRGVSHLELFPALIGSWVAFWVSTNGIGPIKGAALLQQQAAPIQKKGDASPLDQFALRCFGFTAFTTVVANMGFHQAPIGLAIGLTASLIAFKLKGRLVWADKKIQEKEEEREISETLSLRSGKGQAMPLLLRKPLEEGRDAVMLLASLMWTASLLPLDALPAASRITTLAVGLLSSVFDNIPLTKLCLDQGGYIPSLLAYSVGVLGSLTPIGSSAAVALLGETYQEGQNWSHWFKNGWVRMFVACLLGFAALTGYTFLPIIGQQVMLAFLGGHILLQLWKFNRNLFDTAPYAGTTRLWRYMTTKTLAKSPPRLGAYGFGRGGGRFNLFYEMELFPVFSLIVRGVI